MNKMGGAVFYSITPFDNKRYDYKEIENFYKLEQKEKRIFYEDFIQWMLVLAIDRQFSDLFHLCQCQYFKDKYGLLKNEDKYEGMEEWM